MGAIYEYILSVIWHWWWLVTAVLFVIDKTLEWFWSGYREWLTRTFPLELRRRVLWRALLVCVFVSGFLAWKEERGKVEDKQREIDRQAKQLEASPRKEIEQLNQANGEL